ncbi:peptidoglycan-binding protein [Stenotrophomonas maltophilia]|jgi:peptidoglycan hydrolase-like protein with peptidoglycan-binding domain|uniref:VgrG-related protein n=2 Tax=Bacteria TaxID=2 RepID=UPI000DA86908|nr:peptidoglycan-binding protein [Stenotrophomonas sp. PAMC25021]MBH1512946.1 peptidoglycan-binding protein [Stenotrophomonas maltophilia]MBH1547672.1 peptidoglycan-binding protein [Stenotrophomonas maltophilia]MBH1862124.1 peptidoglycan-binding protein [Stenotrophomonas maltophilia]MBN5063384.1 peptidoglycan-binding protein [Stenotrophomonas maltophilia]MCU1033643.1 peptidoglycan-binding protein [Stenotrophomonas maltophilia]
MDVVTQAKQAMDNWHRGQTSAHFETGGRGPGHVSTGRGDHGGVSYGSYQYATNVGGVDEYVAASRYGNRFNGLQAGTPAFTERWKEVAAADPAGFARDQHDFIQHKYYDVQMGRLKDVGIDLSGRGAAVQDALWSTSVQYRGMTRSVFQKGLQQAYGEDFKLTELSDEQIVRAVQDYKHANVQVHFQSSPTLWDSLRDRALTEKTALVGLARYDQVNHNPEAYRGKDYQQVFGEPEPGQRGQRAAASAMADGVLAPGERGTEVQTLQAKLIQAGHSGRNGQPLTADSHYGANTEHAVREFQQAHGLTVDGKAGRQTLQALDTAVREHTPAQPVAPATPAPVTPAAAPAPATAREADAAAAPGGQRIVVVEPFGNGSSNRTLRHGTSGEDAYRELKIHHPNTNAEAVRTGNAAKADRPSAMVEGELETVRTRGDRNGIPLVHKDLILSNARGDREVMIPNPVAGYVQVNNDKWNSISIWSHRAGHPQRELVGQVLHGARGTTPYKTGDFVEYGAPLIRQSDAGTPGAVHAHIELEPDQYRRFLGDMLNDRITLGGKVHAQGPEAAQAARSAQQAPMADGVLKQGERGDEVKALQGKLAALGYAGADGKPLHADGVYGKDTFAAVKQFQANNGLDDDGKAGRRTLAQVDAPNAVKAGIAPAAPAQAEPAAPASMRDAGHADNARFGQALEKLQALEQQRAQAGLKPLFANPQEAERAAGQLAYESKVSGMRQIDHVVARPDGTGLFAVQGELGDPAAQRTFVDRQQAVSHSVEASSRQSEALDSQFNQRAQEQQQEQVRNRGL